MSLAGRTLLCLLEITQKNALPLPALPLRPPPGLPGYARATAVVGTRAVGRWLHPGPARGCRSNSPAVRAKLTRKSPVQENQFQVTGELRDSHRHPMPGAGLLAGRGVCSLTPGSQTPSSRPRPLVWAA